MHLCRVLSHISAVLKWKSEKLWPKFSIKDEEKRVRPTMIFQDVHYEDMGWSHVTQGVIGSEF